jgi:hypothetical protein
MSVVAPTMLNFGRIVLNLISYSFNGLQGNIDRFGFRCLVSGFMPALAFSLLTPET